MNENRTEKILPTPRTEEMPEIAAFEPKSITLPLVLISVCVSFIIIVCIFALVKQTSGVEMPVETSTTSTSSVSPVKTARKTVKNTRSKVFRTQRTTHFAPKVTQRAVVRHRILPKSTKTTRKTAVVTKKTRVKTTMTPETNTRTSTPPVHTVPSVPVRMNQR